MSIECNQFVLGFYPLKQREIRPQFDGGAISSDGSGLLLREVEKRIGMPRQFAACFTDYPDLIEHPVQELVAQRVYGLAWDMKIRTTTRSCGTTPCWRCWLRRRIPVAES